MLGRHCIALTQESARHIAFRYFATVPAFNDGAENGLRQKHFNQV